MGAVLYTAVDDDHERMLIEQAAADPAALERLYSSYFPRVYAYVAYRVGQVADSEDLVSEVFLRAVAALHAGSFRWRQEGSFAAWLFRIARNVVTDYHRSNLKRDNGAVALEDVLEFVAGPSLPEEAFIRGEEYAHLRRLVSTLAPRRQEVITLKFFGGLRNSEIAAVLGLDERTVASHLCRGLDDLQQRMK